MWHEVNLFLLGAVTGMGLSAFFDLLRAFRKNKVHKEWAVAIEDVLFWLIVLGSLFFVVHVYNQGMIRFCIFLGCILGSYFYYLTIGKLVFLVFCCSFRVAKKIKFQCFLIFTKFRKIFNNFLILPLKNIWERIKILYTNI